MTGSSVSGRGANARERVAEHHAARLAMILPPWVAALLMLPLGVLLWSRFGAWWAALTVAATGTALGWLAVAHAHDKALRHRAHLAATAIIVTGWLALADLDGFTTRVTWFAYLIAAVSVPLSWNIRASARASEHQNILARVLGEGAGAADMEGVQFRLTPAKPGSRVIKATAMGVPGAHTGTDIAGKLRHIESGAGLPPGSLTAVQNTGHGAHADVTISDPLAIDTPIPWPGPSRPGASAAEPLRVAIAQTGEPAEFRLTTHVGIFGTTGSAKTTGAMNNIFAELASRCDVDLYALDPTKGRQFLGAWEPVLTPWRGRRVIIDPADVGPFLSDARSWIGPRTEHLAARHLIEWGPKSGLRLKVVWLEEGPEILSMITDDQADQWCSSLKVSRTAGILYVFSGQRPDWTQMPTIARAMINGRLVFGCGSSKDSGICMSERQDRAGVEPADWGVRHPGKFYLDMPDTTDEQVGLACRTYYWGTDMTAAAAYAARWPRQEEEPVMTQLPAEGPAVMPQRAEQDPDPDMLAAEVLGEDEDPVDADLSVPAGAANWAFAAAEPELVQAADPQQAVTDWLAARRLRGELTFRSADTVELRATLGRSRSWLYDELVRRVGAGELAVAGTRPAMTWTIKRAA